MPRTRNRRTVGRVGRSRRGSSSAQRARWTAAYSERSYEELPWFDPDPTPAVQAAARDGFFSKGGTILDIGCGAGSNVLWLAGAGFDARGIDLSPGAIAAARSRALRAGSKADFREGDALNLPFKDGELDGALDHGCFHTLPPSRRPDYVAEVARVIRPDGAFLLAWVAREYEGSVGPAHRPSLAEVAAAFEARFRFDATEFRPQSEQHGLPSYVGRLVRRGTPQPPRR